MSAAKMRGALENHYADHYCLPTEQHIQSRINKLRKEKLDEEMKLRG